MDKVTTLISKGQVTIPKEIRDELGLRPHDKIRFVIEDGEGRFKKGISIAGRGGGLDSLDRCPDGAWDEIIQDDIVQRYAEENR